MTTISGLPTPNVYGATARVAGASANAASTASAANSPALDGVLASLGNNASSPLTYNASGRLGSSSQSASGTATGAQAAQNAVLAAETAVTDTLNSLLSGSSSNASNSSSLDIPALLGASMASAAAGGSSVQTAQDTFVAVQNIITDTLNSLGSGSSSATSGSGK